MLRNERKTNVSTRVFKTHLLVICECVMKLTKMLNQEKHDRVRSFRYKSIRYKLKSFRSINKVDSIHVDLRMDRIDFLRGSNRPVDGSTSKRLWMETI